jgi:hypothetical protein
VRVFKYVHKICPGANGSGCSGTSLKRETRRDEGKQGDAETFQATFLASCWHQLTQSGLLVKAEEMLQHISVQLPSSSLHLQNRDPSRIYTAHVRFYVLTAVNMNTDFWDVTASCLVGRYKLFGRICCFHLHQCTLMMVASTSNRKLKHILGWRSVILPRHLNKSCISLRVTVTIGVGW